MSADRGPGQLVWGVRPPPARLLLQLFSIFLHFSLTFLISVVDALTGSTQDPLVGATFADPRKARQVHAALRHLQLKTVRFL